MDSRWLAGKRGFMPLLLVLSGCSTFRSWQDRVTGLRPAGAEPGAVAVESTPGHALDSPVLSRPLVAPVSTVAARPANPVVPANAEETTTSVEDVAVTAAGAREPEPVPQPTTDPVPTAQTLTLGDILYLAGTENPNVALARERINEAYARVLRAEAVWLPSLRAGVNYNHHEGTIQDVAGTVFQTNRSSFYGGFGAVAVGAGSPAVPGLILQFHLADAIFQPRAASHQAAAREFQATAVRNDVVRDAAVAYLELLRAEQGEAIAQEAFTNTARLAELTRNYAESGQGLEADYQRMLAELALRENELAAQQEAVAVGSARLAQLLRADSGISIITGEPAVAPLELLEMDGSAAEFVAIGLTQRPELCEHRHLVWEAVERLRREKYAPLVPSVLLGLSYGNMGGGLGSSLENADSRWDADAVAFWELRNLGRGDWAARGETASAVRQAELREVAVLDRIAREVTEAHAQVVQRQQRIEIAKKAITAAEKSYSLNLQRIENAQGLPIEVLQAVQSLRVAQRAYLDAVIDHNVAQFELCRATGWFAGLNPTGQ